MPKRLSITVAMAYPRKSALRGLRNYAPMIADHVSLILLYPKDIEVNHWQNALIGPIKKCRNYCTLTEGKVLPHEDVVRLLWTVSWDNHPRQLEIAVNEGMAHMQGKKPVGDLTHLSKVY